MKEIQRSTRDQASDVFEVIDACSVWLSEQGMDHWSKYYSLRRVQVAYGAGSEIYLIYDDEEPVATVTLGLRAPVYYTMNEERENHLGKFADPEAEARYVTALCTKPSHHGGGLAKQLMAFAEQRAREVGAEFLRFDVRADYEKLVEFYKQLGFRNVGIIPPDPGESDEYFLFEKKL